MRWPPAIGRLHDALIDPPRRERTAAMALAAYALVWATYGAIARASQGLHPDMTELVAWSRDLAWGYSKHPPLGAALVWLWFHVFPLAEWTYYLLAMLMPTAALWIAWRLAGDYLDADKRVAGLALLTFIPFFNFIALKYNANTVLLPLWAATTFAFLHSFRTRAFRWAVLAGLAAAASLYGKYWSAMLVAGLAVAAIIDARRAAYFSSPAPWITAAVGLIALAPHLAWLVKHDFPTFSYAVRVHAERTFGEGAMHAVDYLAGAIGYAVAPLAIVLIGARPGPRLAADMVWPCDRERRLAAACFWVPLLLPALIGPLAGINVTALWSMPAFSLLPVLLLSPPAIRLRPNHVRHLLGVAVAIPLLALAAAPIIAREMQRVGPAPAGAQGRLLAVEIERQWRAMSDRPLRFVDGDPDIAYAVAAYATDAPRALAKMPRPSAGDVARAGVVFVCFSEDAPCTATIAAEAAAQGGGRVLTVTIVRNFLGIPGKPQAYTMIIVPPRG